jgi:hypothetical protein
MVKVISFSLWGNDPKYTFGAINNAILAKNIYPDWLCYFFIGPDVQENIIESIINVGNTKIIHKTENNWKGMFWRFETSYDPLISVSIFRDTDSRLSLREKFAVDEWLNSDKTFHIMRDHPHHGFPILGGMWGYKYNSKYPMEQLLKNFDKNDRYGTDYEFFIQSLYPIIGDDKVVHDEFFEKKPFPTARINKEFVGDVFDHNNNRHPEYYRYIP